MRRACLALALALVFIPPAFAWNHFGHMMVAAVAYEQLTPAARAKAMRLLKLNPSYGDWIKGRKGADRDEIAFMLAATWPDEIKTKPGYQNDGEHPGGGPDDARNVGYSDMLQHRYWHFIDQPFSSDHTPLTDPTRPNALTQITAFRKALGSDASDPVKSYDLVWLLHLVGDVHQPLHTAARFTRTQPHGDDGGNKVALCKKPCKDELHGFWDNLLGTGRKPEAALEEARLLPHATPGLAAIADESVWVKDGLQLAQKVVYTLPVGPGAGPYTLDEDYTKAAKKLASQQVALAGARLAHLLNEELSQN
jgi:hypothetical protein